MALWHLIFAILPNFIQVNHVVLLFTKFLYRLKRNRSWLRNDEKNSWNFVCVQAKQCKTPFILTRFFSFFEKCHKFRETLFTFKQNSAELLSFWRDLFFNCEKRQNFVYDLNFENPDSSLMSLDPVKGFGTQSSSKFKFQLLKGKIVSYLLKFSQLFFQCWKGRRRKRFAPEIGAYHLNYRISVLMNLFKLSQQQKSWKKKINSAHSVRHYRSTPTELQAPAE